MLCADKQKWNVDGVTIIHNSNSKKIKILYFFWRWLRFIGSFVGTILILHGSISPTLYKDSNVQRNSQWGFLTVGLTTEIQTSDWSVAKKFFCKYVNYVKDNYDVRSHPLYSAYPPDNSIDLNELCLFLETMENSNTWVVYGIASTTITTFVLNIGSLILFKQVTKTTWNRSFFFSLVCVLPLIVSIIFFKCWDSRFRVIYSTKIQVYIGLAYINFISGIVILSSVSLSFLSEMIVFSCLGLGKNDNYVITKLDVLLNRAPDNQGDCTRDPFKANRFRNDLRNCTPLPMRADYQGSASSKPPALSTTHNLVSPSDLIKQIAIPQNRFNKV